MEAVSQLADCFFLGGLRNNTYRSASVGQFAIQLASIYGLNVVTTCSPRNSDLVKSLGAKHVYDYNSPDVTDRIRKDVPDLKYVFDTIGNEANSSGLAANSASPDSTLCTVRPALVNTEGVPDTVKRVDVMIWTAFLKVVNYKGHEWLVSKHPDPPFDCVIGLITDPTSEEPEGSRSWSRAL